MNARILRLAGSAVVLLILWQASTVPAAAQQTRPTVFLDQVDGRIGHGLLRMRGEECFVVAPAHVVNPDLEVRIVGMNAVEALGRFQRGIADQIAVVKVEKNAEQLCMNAQPWPPEDSVTAVLQAVQEGSLETLSEDGSRTLTGVEVVTVGDPYLRVRPRRSSERLTQGMSGSALILETIMAGILDSVTVRDVPIGLAIRLDHVERMLEPYFPAREQVTREGGFPWVTAAGVVAAAGGVAALLLTSGGDGGDTGSITFSVPNP